MWNPYDAWQKYRVTDVATLEEFLDRYYKPDRYKGRGEEYANCLVRSRMEDLATDGVTIISHHDSVTGRVVSFYPPAAG